MARDNKLLICLSKAKAFIRSLTSKWSLISVVRNFKCSFQITLTNFLGVLRKKTVNGNSINQSIDRWIYQDLLSLCSSTLSPWKWFFSWICWRIRGKANREPTANGRLPLKVILFLPAGFSLLLFCRTVTQLIAVFGPLSWPSPGYLQAFGSLIVAFL